MSAVFSNDPQLSALRVPPHSIEAEQSVLGGLLLDNTAWDRIADIVREDDFYRHDHRLIFQQIAKLIERTRPADVVTVYESLQTLGRAEEAGGLGYLNSLAQEVPSAANIRRYAEIVRDRAILRRLISVSDEIATSALAPQGRETKQILDEAESRVFAISEDSSRGGTGFQHIQPLLAQVVERVDELYNRDNPNDVTGVPTGFVDFDKMTSGLQGGDLVIVAGRPSMGKAQPLDARVRTLFGWKRMGELRVGDALASVDGRASTVTGVFPQGPRQVHRIVFSDGRSTEACDEHLWRVHCRHWEAPRVLSTAQLRDKLQRVRYKRRLWIDMPSGDFGHHEALPVDPWVLGALLGDGSMVGSVVRFSNVAADLLDRMRQRLGSAFRLSHAAGCDWRIVRQLERSQADGLAQSVGVEAAESTRLRPPGGGDAATEHSRGNPVIDGLRCLGLWGLLSHEKFVPRIYLDACRDVRLQVLRGLLDTDGWVESWGSVRYCTTSPQLARDVTELVRSLGGWCRPSTRRPSFEHRGERRQGWEAFVLNIAHPDPASLLTAHAKLERLEAGRTRRKLPTIVSIEPSRVVPTQCISVSHPSRLYVTDDHVVTHNTTLAMNMGEHVAIDQGLPVAVFSMEMGAAQLAMRMVCSVGRLDQQRVRTGRLQDDDWPRLTHAIQKMQDAQLYIDETPALNSLELRSRARRLSRQCGKLGLIIIDYLQLMSAVSSGENRATEISEISRSLKGLAKELGCPVIALSQLNRSLEQRPNKRPVMSDLRESGAIEQDADVIVFIYRDEVYNPDTQDKGTAEIIIGKQRNGPIGTVRLTFLGSSTKFENFAGGGIGNSFE